MRMSIILAIIAVLGIGGALIKVRHDATPRPIGPVLGQPAGSPYPGGGVAGAGLVEPLGEAVAVAPPVPGLVMAVRVQVGDRVAAGDELLRLDERALAAERALRAASLAQAEARLARLRALPRPESLPALAARLAETQAQAADATAFAARSTTLVAEQAIAAEEAGRRAWAATAAAARCEAAAAALAEARAGAWQPDLAVAEAEIAAARAALAAVDTELARLVVRAPRDGTVLRLDVRAGEYCQPGSKAALILGDLSELRVRADIDESDLPRLDPAAPAVAVVRGGSARIPLTLVRREPLMQPKRSLTGDAVERVDVRVAQLLYRCDTAAAAKANLLPGQLVDVYLDGVAK